MYYLANALLHTLIIFVCFSITPSTAEKLPVEYFASLPDVKQVKLAPDGKYFASLIRINLEQRKGTALSVYNLETHKQTYPIMAGNVDFVINWIRWANNRKILVSATFADSRFSTPTTERRLLIIDIKTNKIRNAIPKRYTKKLANMPQIQDRVIDILPEDDEHFLLALDALEPGAPRVYRVSLNKKKMVTIHQSKANVVSWMTDEQHNIRIGRHFDHEDKDTKHKIIHRMLGQKKWQTLWEFESFSSNQVWPIGFDKDPNYLYVNALHEGRDAIFKVDLTDPTLKKELVLADSKYDVNGSLIYSKTTGEVIGLTVDDGDGFIFWDKKYQALQRGINKVLPDTTNYFLSFSRDEKKYILFSYSNTDPGVYYLGNREDKSLSVAAKRNSKLDVSQMAEKHRVNYKARDGLEIEAYVTLPKDQENKDPLPTIIFPHGGPISYDGEGFDYWTQFFANRGYAVLQMNFRGSSGYGYDFMKAGLQN